MLLVIGGIVAALGGGALVMNSMTGFVQSVKVNELDYMLLRMLDEANTKLAEANYRLFCVIVALLVVLVLICIFLGNLMIRMMRTEKNRRIEELHRIEDMATITELRLPITNGEHLNHMMAEDQQMEEAKRQSLKEYVQKLEDELQKKKQNSSGYSLGAHRQRDIHTRKKPNKASRNEFRYGSYEPTADKEDGSLRRRKGYYSSKRQNYFTTDRLDDFHDFQEEKILYYKSAREVDDISFEDFSSDCYRGEDDESYTRQETTTYDDEEEDIQLAIAMSLSLEDQKGENNASGNIICH